MKRPSGKKFTMIEAGLFAAVSALMMILSVSAAQSAAARGKSVTCQDRLKAIGAAAVLYGNDNRGFIPCRVRNPKTGSVSDFGNWLNIWGPALIWGGYFGKKPDGSYAKMISRIRGQYFGCPDDFDLNSRPPSAGSYVIFTINRIEADSNPRYGFSGSDYSRINLKQDRPENSICFDLFPYPGSSWKKAVHGKTANVLHLGGNVNQINIGRAARHPRLYQWIGEEMDGIEL